MSVNVSLRPWGQYETILLTDTYQVKKITVYTQQRLSLQYHYKRSEHWVIVSGKAMVQIGNDYHKLTVNQSVYIPKGVPHRITNIGNENVEFIETQIGTYLGEDDIVRIDDDYGRQ